MSLTPGSRIGVFEITGPLGAGGMGEVYRATDTNLGRQVAIKILPPEFAADAERVARFEREARTLASLNHPNIAQVYGLEKSSGALALVMELVEGEDLSERIRSGTGNRERGTGNGGPGTGLPLDEALPIARQIAEALEAAHDAGIIHRDLKPANIKVRADGTVKVLDFGLAKAIEPGTGNGEPGTASLSPTITTPAMTMRGVILGTAAYMSPEQAKGKLVDRRTDIWAFGCVLFEMLTSTRAFKGDHITDTIVAVVSREPDWAALPAGTPPSIVALLRRCLRKELRQRQQHIGDVRLALEEPDDAVRAVSIAGSPASRRRSYLPWSVAAVATLAAVAVGAASLGRGTAEAPTLRLDVATPSIQSLSQVTGVAVSPDNRFIAFVGGSQLGQILVRALGSGETRALPDTDGAHTLFWSPDSRSLGFFADGRLKRVDVGGGGVATVVESTGMPLGGTWNQDGVILFGSGTGKPLMRVSAAGGTPTPVGEGPRTGLTFHGYPVFLPDGDRFLFASDERALQGDLELKIGSLSGAVARTIMPLPTAYVQIMPPDRVVYLRDGELRAQRVDFERATLTGQPETLATGVPGNYVGGGAFTVSAGGILAYRTGTPRMQLAWFDRGGRLVGTVGDPGTTIGATLSPDGTRVAFDREVEGNRDVWALDIDRGTLVRVTSGPQVEGLPVWSPDGQRLAYESSLPGAFNLYVKSASGQGAEQRLQEAEMNQIPLHWSTDGRYLLYVEGILPVDGDLFALPVAGNSRAPVPIATTPFAEGNGRFSPDGQWVAYQSDASGRTEILVQPFPDPSPGAVQVSVRGGNTPRWSHDGRELYFMAPDGMLMAAGVQPDGRRFGTGVPRALFQTTALNWGGTYEYDVDRAGRFLMDIGNQAAPPIRLLLNWKPGADQR